VLAVPDAHASHSRSIASGGLAWQSVHKSGSF